MEQQISFELKILSSGKQQLSSLKKHLSGKKEKRQGEKTCSQALTNQRKQPITQLLPKRKEELKLKTLSLEGVKTEQRPLKSASPNGHSSKKELLFDNQIHLISVKTVAEMLGIAPKTIHNWVYLRKIPFVKCGRKVMFRPKSLKAWLNRKEIKSWL